jgi:hypothetical protein
MRILFGLLRADIAAQRPYFKHRRYGQPHQMKRIADNRRAMRTSALRLAIDAA